MPEDLKFRMKDIPISIDEVARISYRSGFLNKLMLSSSEKNEDDVDVEEVDEEEGEEGEEEEELG